MSGSPAAGERAALRGYRWQYDHIATRVYDALLDGDFRSLRLTDPEAGRVDDLVLVRRGRVDGYQFKSVEFDSYVSFNRLVRSQRTRSGKPAPSLIQALADGWTRLRGQHENTHVHLVMQQLASINDHLVQDEAARRPSPDHFSAFLTQVLEPLRSGVMSLNDVASEWQPALTTLREASGLGPEELGGFLRSLHLDLAAGSGLPPTPSTRLSDITALSDALLRLVSAASNVVELDGRGVLDLMGWRDRPRLQSRHEFPVDLDTYEPLESAIEGVNGLLAGRNRGYIALIGPPGSGKSTLLSQALSGTSDRVVRYYAYVPGTGPARSRLTARGFLHDLVVLLDESGASSRERQLPTNDVDQLRHQLADQLDAAGTEFLRTRRRTVVVVDGLDHVDREYRGNDSLLAELPSPNELPEGVLLVVGSRTLAPLPARARQQVEERQAVVDLQHHRLSPAAVLEVCRRAPVTATLAEEVHKRIAELSDGHPLALSYLLNRLRDADGEDAQGVLATAPAYEGDIAAEYRALWDAVENEDDVVAILAVCSRLRVGFTSEWLSSWAPPDAVRAFQRKLLYLFRRHHDGWKFFHDSFRQFASDRTAVGDDGRPDARADALAHRRVADLCSEAHEPRIAAEELYHRYCAQQQDDVLRLAQQVTFRDQYERLRSPELIRGDIAFALNVAGERANALIMFRLLLALVELTERTSLLESVDVPGLLYDAGLIDEAVAYCGVENRRVPLAHAYTLAAKLGRVDDPAGRRIFDQIEHDGLDDPDRVRVSGEEDDAAEAWTRAAALFRPLPKVIGSVRNVVEGLAEGDPDDKFAHAEHWRRFKRMMEELIDAVALRKDESALASIDAVLADHLTQLADHQSRTPEGDEEALDASNSNLATLIDLRVRLHAALLALATTADDARSHVDGLLATLRGGPLFHSTMLDASELLARHGMVEAATNLVDHMPYGRALTVHALTHQGEANAVDSRFRYWRLRHVLPSSDDDVPSSVQPAEDTPAGDEVARDAPVHADTEAIELAARIDGAVRTLARLDAAATAGGGVLVSDAWAAIVRLLDVFRPTTARSSASFGGMAGKKSELMRIIVTVVLNLGNGLPQRLRDVLASRFEEQPDRWSPKVRLDLADHLRAAGVEAPWYRETLAAEEASAVTLDVYSRLEETAYLVRRHARDGDQEAARRLVLSLIPMAFGVGYRKDYQFDSWVAWLGRALAEPQGDRLADDAVWLARVLTAADPLTEGAPRSAAAELPAAVASVAPMSAVRIFEYLVRHGTVHHLDALAALLRAVATKADADDPKTVELAVEMTAELLAPAANRAYPDLAEALVAAGQRVFGGTRAAGLAESVARRTDMYALPTSRRGWREGLGVDPDVEEEMGDEGVTGADGYGALALTDGRRLAPRDVSSQVRSVDDIIALRRQETSESAFSWVPVIERTTLDNEDVQRLIDVFNDGSNRSSEVLASLAGMAERIGAQDTALRLAYEVLRSAPPNSWSGHYGGSRRKAAAIAVRLGGRDARVVACRDLAHQLGANRWLPTMLLSEADRIVETLAPDLPATETWPEVRIYLEGIAASLDLPDPDVLADHGCRWWLLPRTGDRRVAGDSSTVADALAELAVGHVAHPTWLVRDSATRVIARALVAANDAVARALGRFAQPDASDDTLERAGRCLAAARSNNGYVIPGCLRPLDRALASHSSQVLRDLAASQSPMAYRPLSSVYDLVLPTPVVAAIGAEPPFLAPHEEQYQLLAKGLGLDLDTLLGVAALYASAALALLPDEEAVQGALKAAQAQHTYPSERIAASRAAFGRVLADLVDARLLDDAPQHVRRRLRTVDIELISRTPQSRPEVIPPPPPAGHDQTVSRWRSEIEDRLEEYVRQSTAGDRVLIGARSQLTVLNWGHLEEELLCSTIVTDNPTAEASVLLRSSSATLSDLVDTSSSTRAQEGDPLILENAGYAFHQVQAGWLAFRPDVAVALDWAPDQDRPGCWYTAEGDRAVETVWWVDGWWGRVGPAFDDTEAEGHAVLLTPAGLGEVEAAVGALTRCFALTRRGHDADTDVTPVSATRTVPLTA
jgi:hypothetical protein